MYREHISYLSDPEIAQKLRLTVFDEADGHIMSGLLQAEDRWYPIINGIPRILTGKLKTNLLQSHHQFMMDWRQKLPKHIVKAWQQAIDNIENFDAFSKHQKKTAESFAYEWRGIYRENDFEKNNFLHYLAPFVKEPDLKNKVVVDVGCGSGRFTKQAALAGAKVVFGTDIGESVAVAFDLTKSFENVCIVQADIYAMPFRHTADLAMSIGVLHHLPNPEEGFRRLPHLLKTGGTMLIWVYSRRHNARALYFYEPLRAILKNLPQPLLYRLCYIPAGAVQLINGVTRFFDSVGAHALAKKVPFFYYANFPFNMKLNDAFDVLATPKSNYYFSEEIVAWFRGEKLKRIKSYEHPESGITCVGVYEAKT